MPDAATLAAFAAFVRALLPRLLIYPGGVFAAACALALAALLARRRGGVPPLPAPVPDGLVIAMLALAWVGWAVLPLPGADPLPGAPDLLTPLGLLAAAALLDLAGRAPAIAWRREALGRPLLLAAPLVILAASGAPGLLPPAEIHWSLASLGAVTLAGSAYLVGLGCCYAAPEALPWQQPGGVIARAGAWMILFGWLGLGAALGGTAGLLAAVPTGAASLVVAGWLLLATSALSRPLLQRFAAGAAGGGWGALGLALLLVLLRW